MFIPDKIISIEELPDEDTIDIAVSDDNLFIANNLLTHNCAYGQSNPGLETMSESMGLSHTADCQFPIWTEEGDVELGIIHLGITKNRFGPRECHTILEIDYPTLSLKDPDDVSKSFTIPKKNLPGSTSNVASISDTLRAIESLDEE